MKNIKQNKITLLSLASVLGAGLLAGCNLNSTDNNGDNGGGTTPVTPIVEEESYVIQVTCPSAITYSLNKTRAKKGEEIVLTISNIAAGVSVKSIIVNNKTTLTSTDGGTTYKFEMPNRSASILITASVEGDVVIEGDITAKLDEIQGQPGVFVAKNVHASGLTARSKFNWVIKSGNTKTACGALDLDETKSFADIEMYGSDYAFDVSNGYTYDFYYDSNNSECPCYVQRVGIDALPTNEAQLKALFIVGPAVRSEYAIYPDNYVGAHFEINDRSTDDVINQKYDWTLYEDNLSFGKVESTSGFDDDEMMYVYKKYDTTNQTYKLVDTYPFKSGSKIINDDRYRPSDNNYGPISGTYNVISEDDYGHRYDVSTRTASRNVRTSSHMPNYFAEREVMYAYRVGFNSDDGVSYSNIQYSPSAIAADGSGNVTVTTIKEYDSSKSGSASTSLIQEGYKYTLKVGVNKRGEITSIDYKEVYFDSESWDFTAHSNKATSKGTTIKTVKATYAYGNKATGTPDYGDFNIDDYFVTSLSGIQLWNSKVDDATSKAQGKSIVGINDTISLYDSYSCDFNPLMANKKYYSPETALDFWQYAPISSSNENVIKHTASNAAYEMDALTSGESTLTIGSHVNNYGPTVQLPVTVVATSLVRDFYMTQYESTSSVEGAVFTTVKAGGTYNYRINPFPYDAALKYHAVSDNTDLLTVTSADNAPVLTINCSGAAGITSTKTVHVTLEAEYAFMDSAQTKRYSPTVFTYTIMPGDIDPVGKWVHADSTYFPNTYVNFTTTPYEGTVVSGMEGAYKATIHDDVYNDGVLKASDNYNFYYKFVNGNLRVVLYEIDMQDSTGWSTDPSDYFLDFQYQSTNDRYLMYLGEIDEYDTESGVTYYYSILGGSSSGYDNSETLAYAPFVRATN